MWSIILMIMLVLTAVFLILLVLVQRGKGGGLAGAFGGMGGQSAFGTNAGDMFTKITIGVSFFWIVLCLLTVVVLSRTEDRLQPRGGPLPPPTAEDQAIPDEPGDVDASDAPDGTPPAADAPAGGTPE